MERQKLRDKYKIAKPVNEDEESEDEDDAFGSVKKKEEDDDAVAREYESFSSRCIDNWGGTKLVTPPIGKHKV